MCMWAKLLRAAALPPKPTWVFLSPGCSPGCSPAAVSCFLALAYHRLGLSKTSRRQALQPPSPFALGRSSQTNLQNQRTRIIHQDGPHSCCEALVYKQPLQERVGFRHRHQRHPAAPAGRGADTVPRQLAGVDEHALGIGTVGRACTGVAAGGGVSAHAQWGAAEMGGTPECPPQAPNCQAPPSHAAPPCRAAIGTHPGCRWRPSR